MDELPDCKPFDSELAHYVEHQEKDPFFDEQLRTHSAEEYQALKGEVERLRRKCEELDEAELLEGLLSSLSDDQPSKEITDALAERPARKVMRNRSGETHKKA